MNGRFNWMTHARSLAWFAVLMAVAGALANIVEILLIDFVHGNPHRMQENALEMMVLFTPVTGLLALVLTLLTYTVPQFFQATVSQALAACRGTRVYVGILLALSLTALITVYSIFHITVPLFDTFSLERGPCPHELTVANYRMAVAVQAPATMFAAAYAGVVSGRLRWKAVIVPAVVLAMIAGVAWGSHMASSQFQFL